MHVLPCGISHEFLVACLKHLSMYIAEKKPKKAKSKAKASPAVEEQEEPKEEVHASLTVSIQLLEGAITPVTLKSLEKDYTGRPAYSALPVILSFHCYSSKAAMMVTRNSDGIQLFAARSAWGIILQKCSPPS